MMVTYLAKYLQSAKGISLIKLIILAAVLVTGLNIYVYFNPDVSLSRYSVFFLLRTYNDNQRRDDLAKIQAALEDYYEKNGEYPAADGWCGRIVSILYPDAKNALDDYFVGRGGIPQDPSFRGTNKDYFYRREDRTTYMLLAVMENAPPDSPTYNYQGCKHWPGNNIFNYQLTVSR